MRVAFVPLQHEVFKHEIVDALTPVFDKHPGQVVGCAGELKLNLLQMVVVDVNVAASPDQRPGLEVAHLRQHHRQQGIACNIEWKP